VDLGIGRIARCDQAIASSVHLIASRAAFGDAAGISLRNVVPAYSIITGVTPFSDGPPLENREGG
jgi:hypothetical protein